MTRGRGEGGRICSVAVVIVREKEQSILVLLIAYSVSADCNGCLPSYFTVLCE